MITRQGLIFPPLHQDYQPVLWNRSPEEKEVFVHAKENPMASHLTPETHSNAKKSLNFQPATCELCGSGEHHSSQCKPLTPEILFESQFCTICSAYGHDERHCPTATCSLCTQSGHTRQHCTFSPSCSYCTSIGHKETQCPTKPCSVCRMIHDEGQCRLQKQTCAGCGIRTTHIGRCRGTWCQQCQTDHRLDIPCPTSQTIDLTDAWGLSEACDQWLREQEKTCAICGEDHHEDICTYQCSNCGGGHLEKVCDEDICNIDICWPRRP